MKFSWIIMGFVILLMLVFPVTGEEALRNDTTKTVIMYYHIKDSNVTFLDAKVVYGHAPNRFNMPDTYTGKMLGSNDVLNEQFGISDPRITYLDHGASVTTEADLIVLVPMSKDLTALGIYDTQNGTLLARGNVTGAMKDFCKAHPNDPDCSTGLPLPFLIGGAAVVLLVAAGAGWFILKKKKT